MGLYIVMFSCFFCDSIVTAVTRSRSFLEADRQSAGTFATASLALSISSIVVVIVVAIAVGVAASLSTWQIASSAGTGGGGSDRDSGGGHSECTDCDAIPLIASSTISSSSTTTTIRTRVSTTTLCLNYLNYFCYPYVIRWASDSYCRFGSLDSLQSACYYDVMYYDATGKCSSPAGDRKSNEYNCYYTSSSLCMYARNYHNGICYSGILSGTASQCSHGFYTDGSCYYDTSYASDDKSCDGGKADRGSNGYCYYTSDSACPYAGNYVGGVCYTYVLTGVSQSTCADGVYSNGNCYYAGAENIGSGFTSLFKCNPLTSDHIGDYCYWL
jgi:hypothetical protein